MSNTVSRRTLLRAAPAVGFAAIVAGSVPVEAATETPIMALYRRYMKINEAWRAYIYTPADGDDEDEAVHRLFHRHRDEVEDQIMSLPSQTAQDMAAKALVSHCHGDMTCLHYETDPFWAEARALVG